MNITGFDDISPQKQFLTHDCARVNFSIQIDCSGLNTNTIDQLIAAREVGLDRTEHLYLNGNALDNLSHFQLMNVSDVVSVEVKSNKIKTLELEELSYFDKIRKLDLEDNQIQFIKNAKRKRFHKNNALFGNIKFRPEIYHFHSEMIN